MDSPHLGTISLRASYSIAIASDRHRKSLMTPNDPCSSNDPPSPCVGICVINPQTQLCDGCLRTLDEIAAWWDYGPTQKRAVLAELEGRLARIMDGAFFD